MINIIFMAGNTGENTDPAVGNELDVARVEIGTAPDKTSIMARVRAGLKRVGLAIVLMAAPACAQEKIQEPIPAVANTDSEPVEPSLAVDRADEIDDEWDLGFGEDLARAKAETAQVQAEAAKIQAALEAARRLEAGYKKLAVDPEKPNN